ncbi:MAG: hypothetical protein QM783_16135 [Phycisphaerales bacterium]
MTQAPAIALRADTSGTVNPLARLSLRTRVAINVVTVTALIQLVLGAVTFLYFRSTIDQFFNFRLLTRVRWAASDLSTSAAPLDTQVLGDVSDRTLRMVMFNTLVLVVRDDQGNVLGRSEDRTDIARLPLPEATKEGFQLEMVSVPHIGTGEEDRVPARTITVPLTLKDGRKVFLTGAISNAAAAETVSVIGRAVLIVSLFGLVATGTAAWFVTGFSLKPLSSLRHVADQFNLETISEPRAEPAAQPVPELAQITAELQAARERIRQAVQSNERFISNVSHELKTPIAVLRAGPDDRLHRHSPRHSRVCSVRHRRDQAPRHDGRQFPHARVRPLGAHPQLDAAGLSQRRDARNGRPLRRRRQAEQRRHHS